MKADARKQKKEGSKEGKSKMEGKIKETKMEGS